MFKSVLREAIIKKDIFLQKSFTTRFHTSTFFSSKNQKKTVTKKGSQGGGVPLPPVYVSHQRKFLYSSLISTHYARWRVEKSMGSQVLPPPAPGCHSGNQTRLWSLGDSDLREFGAIWNGVCLKTVWDPFKVNSKLTFDWREGKI